MSQTQEVKVPVFDLQIGMYVCKLDKEWIETAFPLQGFFIENDNQIQELADECEYVYIDLRKQSVGAEITFPTDRPDYISPPAKKIPFSLKGLLALLNKREDESDRKHTYQLNDIVTHKILTTTIKQPKKLVSVSHEINFATQVHTQASNLLKNFMSKVKEGEPINLLIAQQAIHDCMLSALRSPDALLLASSLRKKNLSIWEHSMRVSVLAISLGRYLNLSDKELEILGLCGMLHDIGALLIPKEILEPANHKTETIQSHTILGRDILLGCSGEFSETVAEVAYSHHEYLNGTGFPRGLKGPAISAYARIITIIDLYVTLTTDGKNDKGLTHYEAVLELLEQANILHFDEVLVDSFVHCIGTYPIGGFVEMNTGEVGIVVEQNPEQKLQPKIMLVSTDDKKPRPHHLIDLAALKNEEILYAITAVVHPDKYPGLNLHSSLDLLKNSPSLK